MPCGPSDMKIAGIPNRSIFIVSQPFLPTTKLHFSSNVKLLTNLSISINTPHNNYIRKFTSYLY